MPDLRFLAFAPRTTGTKTPAKKMAIQLAMLIAVPFLFPGAMAGAAFMFGAA